MTLPIETFEFGIVGQMKFDIGTEVVNGVTRPVTVTAVIQLFVDFGPEGVGLGFMAAICREPWEIINDIYILFPVKLKAVINLEVCKFT